MRVRAAVVGLLTITLVSGCGGGRESHASFARDAGAICRHANARYRRVHRVRPTSASAGRVLGHLVEIGTGALGELRKLKPPRASEASVAAWLDAFEQALDEAAYARSLILHDDALRALGALARVDVLTARVHALGSDLSIAHPCVIPHLLGTGTT
jgi:hypothetical protein